MSLFHRSIARNHVLVTALLGVALLAACAIFAQAPAGAPAPRARAGGALARIPFDGAQVLEYLKQLCAIGPRFSGSPGMIAQQKLLIDHFKQLGAEVTTQEFRARHPLTGAAVPMTNLIIQWHPDRKERVLLGAHYDTRPFPDQDRRNPRGRFIGASDGASGVAVLMELGKAMPSFDSRWGVDFVLFDGEDFVIDTVGSYCLGSEHFARLYKAEPPAHKYRWGVILDLVGDTDLQLRKERFSTEWPDTKPLVEQIWGTAARLGVKEFLPQRTRTGILDDHVLLHNVGGIPTCDIIDLDYPAWHTEADTPAQCSPLSLAKVGWVVHEWLKELK